jgi:enoyl-CoA hydratase/carnithine racemase
LSAVREARGLDFETITYSMEDRVATIAFNRPDQLNAVSLGMKNELGRAFAAAEADADVWPIIVTGNGRAFCGVRERHAFRRSCRGTRR